MPQNKPEDVSNDYELLETQKVAALCPNCNHEFTLGLTYGCTGKTEPWVEPDSYTIYGHEFSSYLFKQMAEGPLPGPWLRVIKCEDGQITVECWQKEGEPYGKQVKR